MVPILVNDGSNHLKKCCNSFIDDVAILFDTKFRFVSKRWFQSFKISCRYNCCKNTELLRETLTNFIQKREYPLKYLIILMGKNED